MEILKRLIAFLKKIGVIKVGSAARTFKSSRDAGYQPPDPLDD